MPADPTQTCLEKAIKAKALFSNRMATSPFEWGCPTHPQILISTQVPYTPSEWWNQVFKQWHANQVFIGKGFLQERGRREQAKAEEPNLRVSEPK